MLPRLLVQRDTFFGCPNGRLKLREEGGAAELIFYSRSGAAGVRESRYWRSPVLDPSTMAALPNRPPVAGFRSTVPSAVQ